MNMDIRPHRYLILPMLLAALTLCGSRFAMAGINDGLVVHYPFDGNANNLVGGAPGITYGNLAFTTDGTIGQAALFDGSNDYIELPEPFPEFNEFTIAMWINPTATGGRLFSAWCGNDGDSGIGLRFDNNFWMGKESDCGGTSNKLYLSAGYSFVLNNWYHIAVTYKSGEFLKFYVNGMEVHSVTSDIPTDYYSYSAYIGTMSGVGTVGQDLFSGKIDDFRIYNRTLSANEAQQLFDMGSGASGNIVYFSGNGHYYEYVETSANWSTALAQAATKSYNGIQGHLVTITSLAENDFIASLIEGKGNSQLGASDEEEEGVWKWVVGPEAGRQFWQGAKNGATVNGEYANWNADRNQPGGTANHYASMADPLLLNYNGRWSDGTGVNGGSYVVEYSTLPASSFSIFQIENTVINQATALAINALDENDDLLTTYSGCANLSLNYSAQISVTQICFSNGVANASVSIDSPANNAIITATDINDTSITSVSNTFSVSDPDATPGALVIKVEAPREHPFTQAFSVNPVPITIYVKDENGAVLLETVNLNDSTFPENFYYEALFYPLPAGKYEVWAIVTDWADWRTERVSEFEVRDNVTRQLEVRLLDIGKPPVLLVHGYLGSTNMGHGPYAGFLEAGLYPKFDSKEPNTNAENANLRIFDPGHKVGFNKLDGALSKKYAVYAAPWDWRLSIESFSMPSDSSAMDPKALSGVVTLKNKIDEVLLENAYYDKVDIVVHSTGGLMVRSYIQSEFYENDIDQVAMVGVPQLGVAKAYFMVQGGEPLETDNDTNDACREQADEINKNRECIYTKTADHLYDLEHGESAYEKRFLRADYTNPKDGSEKKFIELFKNHVKSGKQLLPVYSTFLRTAGSYRPLEKNQNTVLQALNNETGNLDKLKRMTYAQDNTPDKVRVKIFASSGGLDKNSVAIKTLLAIDTAAAEPNLPEGYPYVDGVPTNGNNRIFAENMGDGTVALCSALKREFTVNGAGLSCPVAECSLPTDACTGEGELTLSDGYKWASYHIGRGEHFSLVKVFASEIIKFLDEGQ